jgi:outer membrane biosynthesis protein TonB
MKLSVLMSVYSLEDPNYFNQSIRSIWDDQVLKPDQIVIVENGRLTLELNGIIADWKKALSKKLVIVCLEENQGLARALNNAMNSDDKSLASKAMYNLGNMFRDQQKMEESLALYRKAIELDPTDEDAKVNYELLKQVLQQQEQQQQDKQNQEQDQEKQDQQKQDQDSEGQDEQNKDQEKQEDQRKQQEDQQQSQSEKEKEKKEQQQSQEKQDETQDKQTDKQMQAEAILNALKDQEKINQKRQIAKSKSRKLEKDW